MTPQPSQKGSDPQPTGGTPPAAGRTEVKAEAAVRSAVLASLGRPPGLYRVDVVHLWSGHYRVNVLTGADPAAVRIPHSFFVTADTRGCVTAALPPIVRAYP